MQAKATTLRGILHSSDQYIIPLFQRYYTWGPEDWRQVWEDLEAVFEEPEQLKRHFFGAVVCTQERHQPGVVPAYQVIDGQQRLTTLSLLLCAVRDSAASRKWGELSAEVEDSYLVHRHKKGSERYKVFPRQRDRTSYRSS